MSSGDVTIDNNKATGLSAITVNNANRTKSGIYKIVAENNFGKDNSEIEVLVTGTVVFVISRLTEVWIFSSELCFFLFSAHM